MTITVNKEDQNIFIKVNGNPTFHDGNKFEKAINMAKSLKNYTHVVMNLKDVTMFSSPYISKIIHFFRYLDQGNRSIEIKGISDNLYHKFLDIHLDRIIHIRRN